MPVYQSVRGATGDYRVSDDSSSQKAGAQHKPWYRSTWFIIIAVLAVILIVAVAVYVPVHLTSSTSYCASCHQMKPYQATLEHSVHANVACVSCHVPPGLFASIKWRTKEWVNIWATYLDMPNVSAKQQLPSNANCTSCHNVQNLGPSQTDIRFSHQIHVNLANLTCVDCHNEVSHAKPGQATTVSMTICSMCHSQQIEQNQCSFCHTTPPPKNVHPANYIALHGKQALANPASCLTCHHDEAAFCGACHAKPPADHFSGTWSYTHAGPAKADPASCLGCHNYQTFCQKCHQVNHPANWVTTHGPVAVQNSASCLVCHQQSYCDACHNKMGITP
jgi:nitrate/TMAO reductase-like tetraheme cytochrome c subunit